jgi:hypothetical protein
MDFPRELDGLVQVEVGTVIGRNRMDRVRFIPQDVGGAAQSLAGSNPRGLADAYQAVLAFDYQWRACRWVYVMNHRGRSFAGAGHL